MVDHNYKYKNFLFQETEDARLGSMKRKFAPHSSARVFEDTPLHHIFDGNRVLSRDSEDIYLQRRHYDVGGHADPPGQPDNVDLLLSQQMEEIPSTSKYHERDCLPGRKRLYSPERTRREQQEDNPLGPKNDGSAGVVIGMGVRISPAEPVTSRATFQPPASLRATFQYGLRILYVM